MGDEQIDNYQQRNGCDVWAESQFLSVGEGGDGCVHDANLETAMATCAGDGNLVELLSDESFPTIEDDVWMGMTPDVAHPEIAQNIWYSNDEAFVQEIPEFDAYGGYYMRWTGFITVDSAGDYGFQTRSDDGSLVIIDGEVVVNNDGWHGMQTQSGSIYLSAGAHTITIPFYEDGGGSGLEVSWDSGSGMQQLSYEVLSTSAPGGNVALGKPTEQSSTGWDGDSGLAVDGNTDSAYGSGTCTHTQAGNPEWWQVDLGASFSIGEVDIYHRTDCCGDRLVGAELYLSDSSDYSSGVLCDTISESNQPMVENCAK